MKYLCTPILIYIFYQSIDDRPYKVDYSIINLYGHHSKILKISESIYIAKHKMKTVITDTLSPVLFITPTFM